MIRSVSILRHDSRRKSNSLGGFSTMSPQLLRYRSIANEKEHWLKSREFRQANVQIYTHYGLSRGKSTGQSCRKSYTTGPVADASTSSWRSRRGRGKKRNTSCCSRRRATPKKIGCVGVRMICFGATRNGDRKRLAFLQRIILLRTSRNVRRCTVFRRDGVLKRFPSPIQVNQQLSP